MGYHQKHASPDHEGSRPRSRSRAKRQGKPRGFDWRKALQRGRPGRRSTEGLKRAELVIRFVQKFLRVPSGKGTGGPFILREWQKEFIRDVYAPRAKGGLRKIRRAILSIARKNGKTALIAALVLVHLIGPEAVQNGEIISAANTIEQAAEVFKYASQMVDLMEPDLQARLKVIASTKRIVALRNGSVYKAISRDAKSKHGGNPTVVIYDELAQAIDRDLYDTLDTSMGAREEPLLIAISTQSRDPEHVFSQLVDDGLTGRDPTTVCHLYAVPDEVEDIHDPAVWAIANPALGDFRSLEDVATLAARAKRMPSFEAPFRNLFLNQRVSTLSPLLTRPDWKACGVRQRASSPDELLRPGEPIYLGLDLSGRTDLTALVGVSANDDRVAAWFWKPEGLLDLHSRRDGVDYRKWVGEGLIEAAPGRAIDYSYPASRLQEIAERYDVRGVAYDRWRIEDLIKAAGEIGVETYDGTKEAVGHGIRLVNWGQGYRDMGPAIEALEIAVLDRALQHNGNPVLNWCVANAVASADPAGNRKFDKDKARFRIDGAVALAMACGLKARNMEEKTTPSYTLDHGVLVL